MAVRSDPAPGIAAPAAVVLAAFGLFLATLAPGLLWGDAARFQRMAWEGEMRFDEGGHSLWVLIAHAFIRITRLDPALACNLLSAILSALALWPAFRIMRRIGASEAASVIACLSLAVSHTYWFHAVITEVYALNTLVMLGLLDVAMSALGVSSLTKSAPATADRLTPHPPSDLTLFSAGLACALGGANHNIIFLWVPGLVWILGAASYERRFGGADAPAVGASQGRVGRAGLIAAAAGFALGLAPYLWLRAGAGRGETVITLAGRLLGTFFSPEGKARDAARFAEYLLYQFPLPLIPAAAIAGVRRIPSSPRIGLVLLYICSAGFAFSYPVQDRFAFYLPSYIVLALLAAPGLDVILDRFRGRTLALAGLALLTVVLPPALYRLAPLAARAFPEVSSVRSIPGRDAALYHLYPGKRGDDGARRFAEAALSLVPPRALVIADDTPAEPLDYLQVVEGKRTDVEVLYASPARQLQVAESKARLGRGVYLAASDGYYNVEALGRRFEIVPEGPIYHLVPR